MQEYSRLDEMNSQMYPKVESAILCNLDIEKLNEFPYTASHFSAHGDALNWVKDFVNKYKKMPTVGELTDAFPNVDADMKGYSWDFVQDIFKKQVIYRKVDEVINSFGTSLRRDPQKGVVDLQSELADIELEFDDDISVYDDGTLDRLQEYKADREKLLANKGIMGISTPFNALKTIGSGWKPGELIGIFARSGVGKTWFCTEIAATAVLEGTKTLFITPELTTKQYSARLDTVLGYKMGYKFLHSDLANLQPLEDEEAYKTFLQNNNSKSHSICHAIKGEDGITIQSIKRLIRRYKPEFVIVDGIYLIRSQNSRANQHTWEKSYDLANDFKTLATQENISICVSTQANRESFDEFEPPRANTVAFGDGLLSAADYLFSMAKTYDTNGDYDEKLRKIRCLKIRDGAMIQGDMTFAWDVNKGIIEEKIGYAIETSY